MEGKGGEEWYRGHLVSGHVVRVIMVSSQENENVVVQVQRVMFHVVRDHHSNKQKQNQ